MSMASMASHHLLARGFNKAIFRDKCLAVLEAGWEPEESLPFHQKVLLLASATRKLLMPPGESPPEAPQAVSP